MSKDNQRQAGGASGKNTEEFERAGGNSPIGCRHDAVENVSRQTTAGQQQTKKMQTMKLRILLPLVIAFGFIEPVVGHADDLFRLYWRGTYYTTNSSGHIVAVPFTEQSFVNKVAQDNGLDPAGLIFVYRPDRRDTVVVRSNGAFVADVIQMEFTYTDVNNPNNTVTVRQALLFDEYHQDALGSWMGLELRTFNPSGGLANDTLTGWMQYSMPEQNAVYGGRAYTGARVVDNSGAP